ncbi:DUF4037 domain-containing protein [Spirochaeta dissipatitropha]
MSSYTFIPGIELNRAFYFEVVKPLLEKAFPDINHSASLIGYGSDVLGYDNPTSMDHNWGPRCQIFLDQDSMSRKDELHQYFSMNLPLEFKGFPTNYTDPRKDATQSLSPTETYPITHLIEICEPDQYFAHYLGLRSMSELTDKVWLDLNDQALLELTKGEVFHDGLQTIREYRKLLKWFPQSVYILRLASLWMMVANEEAFIGRCIELDDYIGLKIISTRIVNTLLKILFYLEKQYVPYSKWFGTNLKSLSNFPLIEPSLRSILSTSEPNAITEVLNELYRTVINIHNQQTDLPGLDNTITNYYGRPYCVIDAGSISSTLQAPVTSEHLQHVNVERIALSLKVDSVDPTE